MSAGPCPATPRLSLRPRSTLLERIERALAKAGPRLDRLDPPPPPVDEGGPRPAPRLIAATLPRADR
jgi:hypothetical protein